MDGAEASGGELWDDCPLFAPDADSVPRLQEGVSGEDLPDAVVALSHLLYDEDTPEERLDVLREEGNTMFKHGHPMSYKRAIVKYTEALAVPCDLPGAKTATYANRAAAQLKLKNYSRALADAEAALDLDADHIKSRYRAALCAKALYRYDAALIHCDAGVATLAAQGRVDSPDSALFARVRKEAVAARDKEARNQAAKRLQEEKRARADSHVSAAIARRGVTCGLPLFAQQRNYAQTAPVLDAGDGGDVLLWPVLVVYPDVVGTGVGEQSDYLESVSEDATIGDLITTLFPPDAAPPPWDVSGVYSRRSNKLVAQYRRDWTMRAADADSDDERDFCGSNLGPDDVGEWQTIPRSLSLAGLVKKRDYITPMFPVVFLVPA